MMPARGTGNAASTRWQRQLMAAASAAAAGAVVHVLGPRVPAPAAMVGLGIGLIGAGFMMAWGADAGDAVFSGGPVLAVVALLTVLPEFVIEVRFAFIQATELVTANLTGATRLLLAGAMLAPLLVAFLARRQGAAPPDFTLGENRRLELGVLLLSSAFAVQVVVRGQLSIVDGILLIALYIFYARRIQGIHGEVPAVVGVAAGLVALAPRRRRPAIAGLIVAAGAVVFLVANPFADALLATGTALGMDPYVLIQSAVPLATEAPEFVVVAVLVANHRPAQGLALFLASSVSQWTLGMGALPLAFMAGGGGPAMPLAPREQLELAFTITTTMFVVAALLTLRPERADAWLMGGIFVVQLVHPAPAVRLAAAFVLLVFALSLMWEHRRHLRVTVAALWREPRALAPPA